MNLDPVAGEAERWEPEQSAHAAQRLTVLGEMTGGIAHDFRNILAVIDSALRLAERNLGDQDKASTFIAGAREGVTRGLRLTSRLLSFAGQKALPISVADVNALITNLKLFLEYGAGSSVQIEFQLTANVPQCVVDPSQFAAAILNLVVNARDAMPPSGGYIQISTARCELEDDTHGSGLAGAYVRIRVKDNGLGMSEYVMQKLFEPFFTTKGESGTGLGIPQVCAFMRHMGGRVSVESSVGLGTTFDLFLPVIDRERPQADAA